MNRKFVKVLLIAVVSILGLFALFYLGGIAGQVLENYQAWLIFWKNIFSDNAIQDSGFSYIFRT